MARNRLVKFLILAEPRSGTTFLNTVLNRFPGVRSFGEILPSLGKENQFHEYWLKRVQDNPKTILLDQIPIQFQGFLRTLFSGREEHVLGVDVKYYQLEWKPEFLEVFRLEGFRVLHVVRKNLLQRHVSLMLIDPKVREALGRKMHTSQEYLPAKIDIENGQPLLDLLRTYAARIEHYRRVIKGNFAGLELCYETMVDRQANSLTKEVREAVCSFLDTPLPDESQELASRLKPMNPPQLRNKISNYHQVIDTLAGTDMAWMLDDAKRDTELRNLYAQQARGERALARDDRDTALALFMKGLALDPEHPDLLFNLGLTYAGMGLAPKALAAFESCLRFAGQSAMSRAYAKAVQELSQSPGMSDLAEILPQDSA